MSEETDRILRAARAGDPVALTRALVATPSVNPGLEEDGAGAAAVTGEATVADLTAGWLRAWGPLGGNVRGSTGPLERRGSP